MNSIDIYNKFKNKLLGARSGALKPDYFVDDFINEKSLVDFIVSTYDNESAFTKDGFEFIELYYGLDNVIDMVLKDYPHYPFDDGLSPREALLIKKEFALDMDVLNKMP